LIGTTTLADYLVKAGERLPDEANRVLEALINEGNMNKEDLSLLSRVKRAVLDHVIMQLYALGLVDVSTEGKSKICSLTKLGEEYLALVDERKAG